MTHPYHINMCALKWHQRMSCHSCSQSHFVATSTRLIHTCHYEQDSSVSHQHVCHFIVTSTCVMSRMFIVTSTCVTSVTMNMTHPYHINMCPLIVTPMCVMSRMTFIDTSVHVRIVCMWMSHVSRMNQSCRIYEWAISHMWMSHVTHMNESCHACEWVMSRIWMSHVTRMNESHYANESAMLHTWTSHTTHINEPCHTYEWAMWHVWNSHVTQFNESCQTYEWVMSHTWMSHVTHAHDSRHTRTGVMSRVWTSHVTFENNVMQVLRKSCVSFPEYSLFYRTLLQKRRIIRSREHLMSHKWICQEIYIWRCKGMGSKEGGGGGCTWHVKLRE